MTELLEFSDKEVAGKITIEMQITHNDVESIMVSSFEGGSNYWMGLDNDRQEWHDMPNVPNSQWAAQLLLDGKTVFLYDIEDEEERFELTLEKLLNGLKKEMSEHPESQDRMMWDADVADRTIQYALFNELVYG